MSNTPPPDEAREFVKSATFSWHQRWELVPGVVTPGANDIAWLLQHAGLPTDLTGLSVLDIGTTNGAGAFLAENRGAARVVAVDIFPPDYYGFIASRTCSVRRPPTSAPASTSSRLS